MAATASQPHAGFVDAAPELKVCSAAPKAKQSQSLTQTLVGELLVGGAAVGSATAATSPLDVIKVRLQLQRSTLPSGAKAPGLIETGVLLVRNEGVGSLYKGITPSIVRGVIYGGMRLGLYNPIKDALRSDPQAPLSTSAKLGAGVLSGAVAAAACSPLELAKVRMQAKGNPHKSTTAVLKHVFAQDGLKGLWRGSTPGMIRAALLTSSQCVAYDWVKHNMLNTLGWKDGLSTHLAASMVTGIVTTTVTNPVDVVKNVVFVSGAKSGGTVLECTANILKTEGPKAFMKGWVANYARLGPQTVITFVVAEKLRSMVGMEALGKV